MKTKAYKDIPKFASEQEEKAFWDANDSTEYIDCSKAKKPIFQAYGIPMSRCPRIWKTNIWQNF